MMPRGAWWSSTFGTSPPRIVILPFSVGRHPDHRIAAELGRDACYLAGLARYPAPGTPHRPVKILYAMAYREDPVKPTFVVDISAQFERKMTAIPVLRQPFDGAKAAGEIFPTARTFTRWSRPKTPTTDRSSGAAMASRSYLRDHGGDDVVKLKDKVCET